MIQNPLELIENIFDNSTTLTDELVNQTINYIKENSTDETLVKLIEIRFDKKVLHKIYFNYMLTTTHSDVYIDTVAQTNKFNNLFIEETRDKETEDPRAIKKDLEKIIKYLEKIQVLYNRNYVGLTIERFIKESGFEEKQVFKGLGQLKVACNDALRYYSPEQGRRPSLERQARIDMIGEIIKLFELLELPCGSQQEGKFDIFIKSIYEELRIPVNEPHQDIKLAKKKQIKLNN